MVDRFLRVNSRRAAAGVLGAESQLGPTIIVQPTPPQPQQAMAYIVNQSQEARVACDAQGLPAVEATVRGRPVFQSSYGDGTNGYTTLQSPSLNTGITAGPDSLFVNAEGLYPENILTCMDVTGKAQWQPPTQLISAVDPATCFIRLGAYNIQLETNFDQPAGKLRLRIQTTIQPGQILTSTGNDGECQWVYPAETPPTPSIYTSNVPVSISPILVPVAIYPGRPITSTTEFWSMTADSSITVAAGGPTVVLSYALFNILGVQYGPTYTQTVNSSGNATPLRLVYQYAFRKVSNTEIRLTVTATLFSGTVVTQRNILSYASVDVLGGIPFPRIQKNTAVAVSVDSMAAYYTCPNWEAPAAPVPFAAMEMRTVQADEAVADEVVVVMLPPEKDDFPVTIEAATAAAIGILNDQSLAMTDRIVEEAATNIMTLKEQGVAMEEKLVYVYKEEETNLRKRGSELGQKLEEVCESLVSECEKECDAKRQRLI